tara:strand:- start:1535 stop:2221 length:687 start_codon:yes stop_codon:yes gene_type:complete
MNLGKYRENLENFYREGTSNHEEHNRNPDYFDILLHPITSSPKNWAQKVALDFGCGKGRNVTNLLELANWKRVDGVDISEKNINYCKTTHSSQDSSFYKNNGVSLKGLNDHSYHFIMSTIVFQHIPVREMRINLKKEIYRLLKKEGTFSFQMGHGNSINPSYNHSPYHTNAFNSKGSNGACDVQITPESEKLLMEDLNSIGFKDINHKIRKSFSDRSHENWIYVNCKK